MMIQHKPDCKPGLRFEQYIMPVIGSKCLYCGAEEITKHVSSIDWQSRHARLIERLDGLVYRIEHGGRIKGHDESDDWESEFIFADEVGEELQQIIDEAKQ